MDRLKCILFLCLFLLGGTLAAKNEVEVDDENDFQGYINIDENKGMYQGSGDKEMNDDDDMMSDGSGIEIDGRNDMETEDEDEDFDMGSAEMEKDLTDCKRLKLQTSKMKDLPYVPKCTDDGLFEVVQCNFNYGECFCVDNYGRKIIGTSKFNPDKEMRRTMCDNQFREIDIEGPTKGKGVKSRPGQEAEEDTDEAGENVDQEYFDQDLQNNINTMNGGVEVDTIEPDDNGGNNIGEMLGAKGAEYDSSADTIFMGQPGLLAAIVGGTVVGLLCAVLLVMFIVYRMRKKDEGSYALDEPKRSPSHHQYQRASNREFYA